MKKLLAMLGATGLVVSTGAILVSCNEKTTPETPNTQGTEQEITVDFGVAVDQDSIVLSKVEIKKDEVLTIVTNIELAEGSTLEGNKLTGKLSISDDVEAGDYVATFTAKKVEKAEGDDVVTISQPFTVAEKLSTVIKEKALGELDNSELASIETAIKAKNTGVELGVLSLKGDATATEATIISDTLRGEVVVTYTIKDNTAPGTPDKTALTAALTAAKDEKAKPENTQGVDALDAAIKAAEEVAANEKATQEEVNSAANALNTAIDKFKEANKPAPVDKTALTAAIKAAKDEKAKPENTEGVTDLDTAIGKAEEVETNEKATQKEVSDAAAALTEAIDIFKKANEKA